MMKFSSKPQKYAIIDVGSNNVLLLLAQKNSKKIEILKRKSIISAMGKNMHNQLLTSNALQRTKKILHQFIIYSRLFTENIIVIGTSSSREAKNINILSDWLLNKYDLTYNIISGEYEAFLNGAANIGEFPQLKNFLLFDIGGGSTEFTLIENQSIIRSYSIKLGIRRLQNEFGNDLENKIQKVRELLKKISLKTYKLPLVGIGGTVTSLAAIQKNLVDYDEETVHKSTVTAAQIKDIYKKIIRLSYREIAKLIPFDPERSDIILTGTMIVKEILNYFNADEFIVSDKGIQYGILNLKAKELKEMTDQRNRAGVSI